MLRFINSEAVSNVVRIVADRVDVVVGISSRSMRHAVSSSMRTLSCATQRCARWTSGAAAAAAAWAASAADLAVRACADFGPAGDQFEKFELALAHGRKTGLAMVGAHQPRRPRHATSPDRR